MSQTAEFNLNNGSGQAQDGADQFLDEDEQYEDGDGQDYEDCSGEEEEDEEDPIALIIGLVRDCVVEQQSAKLRKRILKPSRRKLAKMLMPPWPEISVKRPKRSKKKSSSDHGGDEATTAEELREEQVIAVRAERKATEKKIKEQLTQVFENYFTGVVDLIEDSIDDAVLKDEDINRSMKRLLEYQHEQDNGDVGEFDEVKDMLDLLKGSYLERINPLLNNMDAQRAKLSSAEKGINEKTAENHQAIKKVRQEIHNAFLAKEREIDQLDWDKLHAAEVSGHFVPLDHF